MEYRTLGKTGLRVSEIGFGTGGISELMVTDDHAGQLRVVREAVRAGVTYFDTAAGYGAGKSESNLGRALKTAGGEAVVATKIRLGPDDLKNPRGAAVASVERSLGRLGRDSVDVIQIHNYIAPRREWPVGIATLDVEDVLGPNGVIEGFRELRDRGKVNFFGFTGIGDPASLISLAECGEFHTAQAYFNLLNPSAGHSVPDGFAAVDYRLLIDRAAAAGLGVLVIRVLALGALTADPGLLGFLENTPPLLSLGSEFDRDARRAGKLACLVDEDITLAQAAIRFALMKEGVSSVLVGFSNADQLEESVTCSKVDGLEPEIMERLRAIWEKDFS